MSEQHGERAHAVRPLELFFDLVFVFGFTQVTTVLSDNATWSGLGHGLLILATLWWAWASYAWLTNTVDLDLDEVWGAMLVAMGAMFVAALAVPDAFRRHGVVFGVAFLIVAVMQPTLYAFASRGDRDLLAAIMRYAPWALSGATLILVAGFVHGGVKPILWLAALAAGLFGPLVGGMRGWNIEPAHFVERHGLIVIIAIGESLIAVGVGERRSGLSTGVIVAAVLGFVVATSFWLAYFDFFPARGERLLADRSGPERTALARDLYSYLHLPMVAGIMLFAFAMRTTLAHVGDELDTIPALGLCGGPALYLLAYVALRVRVSRTVGRGRLLAAIACALLLPVALVVPALAALTLVAAVLVGLHAYELIWWREARAQTRAQRHPSRHPEDEEAPSLKCVGCVNSFDESSPTRTIVAKSFWHGHVGIALRRSAQSGIRARNSTKWRCARRGYAASRYSWIRPRSRSLRRRRPSSITSTRASSLFGGG